MKSSFKYLRRVYILLTAYGISSERHRQSGVNEHPQVLKQPQRDSDTEHCDLPIVSPMF